MAAKSWRRFRYPAASLSGFQLRFWTMVVTEVPASAALNSGGALLSDADYRGVQLPHSGDELRAALVLLS
jgi:hypothetical protein